VTGASDGPPLARASNGPPLARASNWPPAGRSGFWQAVAVEVEAFGRRRRLGPAKRAGLALRNTLATLFYERRVHPSGEAVCLLQPRHALVGVVGISVLAGGTALGVFAPLASLAILCAAVLFATAASSFPAAVVRAVKTSPARWHRRRLVPKGKRVYLRSLASTRKGAGAELLAAVVEEADLHGWTLVLDAADPALVRYYERFGFACAARVQPDQETRMWRASRRGQGPHFKSGTP
jgi:hypothetical protein